MKNLFLHNYHSGKGAEFRNIEKILIPVNYGNVINELNAINNTVALLDRSYLGKVLVKGKDSLDLLNRISTNDLQYLSMGTVCDTIFVTPKGRLIDYCRIINIGENQYILICSFIKTNHVLEWINRFIILEDVEISDVSDEYIWLTLLGPHDELFLSEYSTSDISENDETIWLEFENIQFFALKNTNFIVPAYNFCFLQNDAKSIFPDFINTLRNLDGKLIGDTAFQIIRIESGMPDCGNEITEDYNPHEARLIKAVSFTKGCYTGQEVIARLDTYDKVQKYLMIVESTLKIEQETPIDIFIDDELIGILTSYVFNPNSGNYIGLGYIKKMYTTQNDLYVELEVVKEKVNVRSTDGINLELQTTTRRVPAKLRKPPTAY